MSDEVDVCALWQETEMHEERRLPWNRGRRVMYDLMVELLRRERMRAAVEAAGLDVSDAGTES